MNEGTKERRNEGTKERRNEGAKERRNEGRKEGRKKGTRERKNEGTKNEKTTERRSEGTMVPWHEGETKRRNGGTKGRSFEATNARRREKTNKHGRRETKEWKNWWFIQTLESVETKLGLVRSDDLNSISFSPWSSMVQSLSFSLKHEYVMFWYTPLLKSLRKLIWPVVALYSNCGEKKTELTQF